MERQPAKAPNAQQSQAEREVVTLRIQTSMSQSEIAECVGVTKQRVSQILRKNADYLRGETHSPVSAGADANSDSKDTWFGGEASENSEGTRLTEFDKSVLFCIKGHYMKSPWSPSNYGMISYDSIMRQMVEDKTYGPMSKKEKEALAEKVRRATIESLRKLKSMVTVPYDTLLIQFSLAYVIVY